MKVAVVYASKHGYTKGIAEHIRDKIAEQGVTVELRSPEELKIIEDYDAFIIGSAVYFGKWMKSAHQFIINNQQKLARYPVWLFSSGPVGTETKDKQGRDLLETSIPEDIVLFKRIINPRDHHVFYGGYDSTKDGGITGWFVRRIPNETRGLFEGDFRNWPEIDRWAENIAKELKQ